MRAEVIDGQALARRVLDGLREQLPLLLRPPGLAVLIVGDDPASHLYVNSKAKVARELGYYAEVKTLLADADESAVLAEIA